MTRKSSTSNNYEQVNDAHLRHLSIISVLVPSVAFFAYAWLHPEMRHEHKVAGFLAFASGLAWLLFTWVPPVSQPLVYHDFADKRSLSLFGVGGCCSCTQGKGIPNAGDVLSNIPFLFVGIWLTYAVLNDDTSIISSDIERISWAIFGIGVALVSLGSGYYHWAPDNQTLVWDRLPMTIGFMSMMAIVLDERLGGQLLSYTMPALIVVGFASVVYWAKYDDLRPYIYVQAFPLLSLPILMALFPAKYTHTTDLLLTLGCYLAAKVTEDRDKVIFRISGGRISGHTIKHLLAALGIAFLPRMLMRRSQVLN